MINLEKIKYEKCQPLLLRRPAPAPYFYSLFFIFQIPLRSGGSNQNFLPSFKKKGVVQTMAWSVAYVLPNKHNNDEMHFIFPIFVPMSTCRSICVVSMGFIFHFYLHFHSD